MAVRIIKPEQQAFLKTLIFAPHKHGKTTFVATAQEDPRTAPILLLDFEGNTECLVGLDIDIVPVRSWDDFNEIYALLRTNEPRPELGFRGGYKTVAIDSITEVNFYALLTEMSRQAKKGREEPDQAQMQDFGKVLTQMRRLLRQFRDLPMHVIYTALDDTTPEPGEGMVRTPLMIGQMKREVGALVSVVGYLSIRENQQKGKERVLLLHDIPRFRIGVRTPWRSWDTIPQELEDPTVTKLMDAVYPRPKVVEKAS